MGKGPSILSVDQSAITGESLAVEKFVGDVAYYTCGVKRGKAYGVATCGAQQSFVGKTANLVMSSHERGHFQIVLDGIGNALLVVVIAFIFIVWIGGFFRHLGIATPAQNNLLVYALIFLVRSLLSCRCFTYQYPADYWCASRSPLRHDHYDGRRRSLPRKAEGHRSEADGD